jgi:hypothetical protein
VEIFVSVAVILGMIVLGVFLIHQLNSQHNDRIAAFHYGRARLPVAGPAPHKARDRAGTSGTGRRHDHRGPGGRGRFSWRRPRKQA